MLHHRTTDPGERAASIADHEADAVFEARQDFGDYFILWSEIYRQALWEFAGKPTES